MDVYGYDGSAYRVGSRVELHPGTDYWMAGARYGVVEAISLRRVSAFSTEAVPRVCVRLDRNGRTATGTNETFRAVEAD